jgi:hypothetical protein
MPWQHSKLKKLMYLTFQVKVAFGFESSRPSHGPLLFNMMRLGEFQPETLKRGQNVHEPSMRSVSKDCGILVLGFARLSLVAGFFQAIRIFRRTLKITALRVNFSHVLFAGDRDEVAWHPHVGLVLREKIELSTTPPKSPKIRGFGDLG